MSFFENNTFYVFVLVTIPERIQIPTDVRVPAAVTKARTLISETKPQFEKRILEERHPVTRTHVNDDWFVLLDADHKESGIFYLLGFVLPMCSSHMVSIKRLLTFAAVYMIRSLLST